MPSFSLPEYRERLAGAMTKAAREARRHTSWARPQADYESRLTALIDAALNSLPFMDAFRPFQQRIARAGATNSLVQLVLKLTVPGVPDIYQGTELWDLSLVDPDNRRPVDYARRAGALETLLSNWALDPAGTLAQTLADWQGGDIKLLLTALLLRLRNEDEVLTQGDYQPCEVDDGDGTGAFLRCTPGAAVLVVFGRFPLARPEREPVRVALPGGYAGWRDVLRGGVADPARGISLPAGLSAAVFKAVSA